MKAFDLPKQPKLFLLISGPSGSGKTTLATKLLSEFASIQKIVTSTTRSPRANESAGEDYNFLTKEKFDALLSQNAFIEHAEVYGKNYGILKDEILNKAKNAKDLILTIDVQGANTLQSKYNQLKVDHRLVTIFLVPENAKELKNRLLNRNQDSDSVIERRVQESIKEIEKAHLFNYVLVSKTIEEDWDAIKNIYLSEKMRNI